MSLTLWFDTWQIQFGTSAHVEEVQQLLSGVADMSVAMTAFADGMHANTAFVASCQGQVCKSIVLSSPVLLMPNYAFHTCYDGPMPLVRGAYHYRAPEATIDLLLHVSGMV